ncbi:MAG TPA: MFS transporter [Alphaproteobacteria bacterium]|nr:MFS transporter [Alphaproteobacteria bacterium]
MAAVAGLQSILRTLGQRNFRIYLIGSSISLIGTWVHRIAIGWLTWELTHSFIWLGAVGAAELAPTVLLGPFAGALADRFNRQHLAMISQSLACAQAVVLVVLVALDLVNPWVLLGLTIFIGVAFSFGTMARLTIFPMLVERSYLPSAIAINAAFFNLARFLGPAVGGGLIAAWGVGIAFALNAATFVVFIFALSRLRIVVSEGGERSRRGLLADVGEGLSYAVRHPGIGPTLLILLGLSVGVKGFPELLPGFVDVVFGRGVEAFAALTAATGIGAAVAAFWAAGRGRMDGLTRINLAGLLGAGLSVIAFAATGIFWVGLVCLFLAGAFLTIVGTSSQALMQNAVEGAMRGRVMSLYGLLFRGGPALSALIIGVLAELIGLQISIGLAAAGAALVAVMVFPRLGTMAESLEAETPPDREQAKGKIPQAKP